MRILVVTLIVLSSIFLGVAIYWNYFAFKNEELKITFLKKEFEKLKSLEKKANNDSLEKSLAGIVENIALTNYKVTTKNPETIFALNNYSVLKEPLEIIIRNNKKAHNYLVFTEKQLKNLEADILHKNTDKELLNKYLDNENKRIQSLFEYYKNTEPLIYKLKEIHQEYNPKIDCIMSKLSACD